MHTNLIPSQSIRPRSRNKIVARSGQSARWKEGLAPYIYISPFLLFFLVLFLGPALYSLALSFFRYSGFGDPTWVGLDNFEVMTSYDTFWTEIRNTLFYWFVHMIPMVVFAFGLALLVNSAIVKHKHIFKPVIFVPQVVAAVAASMVFQNFFGTRYGIFNNLLGTQIPWLQDMSIAPWSVIILLVWRMTGYWFVILLAGLTAINTEVLEAAIVDGASSWQRLIRITIPLMRKTFLFVFVVDAIWTLRLFTEPNVLAAKPGGLAPVEMAPVLNLVVEKIRAAQFGQAAAVGWLLFILVAAVSWMQFRLFQGKSEEG